MIENIFYDFWLNIKRNKKFYIMFSVCLLVGIIIGLIVFCCVDNGLFLLNSTDNILNKYVNGTIRLSKETSRVFLKFFIPMIIIFGFSLNFYLSFFVFAFFLYQGLLFSLTICQLILEYSLAGIIDSIFFVLPINIVIFLVLMVFSAVCLERCYLSHRQKEFCYGYNKEFFINCANCVLLSIVTTIVFVFVLFVFLKCNIFILF